MLSETKSAVAKGEGGRKILAYLWLPLVSFALLILIYGGLTIADLKNQNQKLAQKQNELQQKITQLEKGWQNPNVEVAGASSSKKILSTNPPDNNIEITSGATPTPSPSPSKTFKPRSLPPTPTPSTTLGASPTPTPTPSPTPTPTPVEQATVAIENVGAYAVNLETDDTAFSILLRAGQENGFTVDYQWFGDLGAFVNCIAGICGHDNYYWAFYYNGSYSMVGASSQTVLAGDETAWKFESF